MILNKTITIYFQNKNNWQIATDLHKKSKKCETPRNCENVSLSFLEKTKEREVGERGGRQEQQRERREQKSKAGPCTLPNSRSPASGGNYWYNYINKGTPPQSQPEF